MSRHVETFDHTADVGLDARADTFGELLQALAEGMVDVAIDRETVEPVSKRAVAVESEDREALVVDFLSEVLSAVEVDRFLPREFRILQADETGVRAELLGEPLDRERHEVRTEIKAVTYHQLRVSRDGDRWTGRVILDL